MIRSLLSQSGGTTENLMPPPPPLTSRSLIHHDDDVARSDRRIPTRARSVGGHQAKRGRNTKG